MLLVDEAVPFVVVWVVVVVLGIAHLEFHASGLVVEFASCERQGHDSVLVLHLQDGRGEPGPRGPQQPRGEPTYDAGGFTRLVRPAALRLDRVPYLVDDQIRTAVANLGDSVRPNEPQHDVAGRC